MINLRDYGKGVRLDYLEDLEVPDWYEGPPFVVMKGDGKVSDRRLDFLKRMKWGRMWAAGTRANIYPGEPWGFDNGAFSSWTQGSGEFPEKEFLERLEAAKKIVADVGTPPLVAVVPDLLTKGNESLTYSVEWVVSGELPSSWPWYLALQPGMDLNAVREVLPHFDGLFIGGGHEFKSTTRIWLNLAREHEMPFHYGGCGTIPKLIHASDLGVDSIDSASPYKSKRVFVRFMTTYFEICRRELENG